jgi:hypothetical protein
MKRRVVHSNSTDVLEAHVASILGFTQVSCLAYLSTLKMEMTCSSETSVDFRRVTWRYIPVDETFHTCFSEWLD